MFAAAVPVGTFLANLVPWSTSAHPAAVLYAVSVALAVVIALAALLGPWRRATRSRRSAWCACSRWPCWRWT